MILKDQASKQSIKTKKTSWPKLGLDTLRLEGSVRTYLARYMVTCHGWFIIFIR